jgi:hypothetical protein
MPAMAMPGEMASVINAMTNVTAVIVTNRNRFIIPPKQQKAQRRNAAAFTIPPMGLHSPVPARSPPYTR